MPPKKFEDAVAGFLARQSGQGTPGWAVLFARLAMIAAYFGVGLLLRVHMDVSWPVAVIISSVVFMAFWVLIWRVRPLGSVDWDSAESYWQTAQLRLPPANAGAVAAVTDATLGRYRGIRAVHPYLATCPAGVQDGMCKHPGCRGAGVLTVGARRVVVINPRVAHLSAGGLEAVLVHEMRHSTGIMGLYCATQVVMNSVGWFLVGFVPVVPPAVGVPALWGIGATMAWANELIADIAALRSVGAQANLEAFRAAELRLKDSPVLLRVLFLVMVTAFPTHPPTRLRMALIRVTARLGGSRSRQELTGATTSGTGREV
jgi:Zn-dependent protease with chaperone function